MIERSWVQFLNWLRSIPLICSVSAVLVVLPRSISGLAMGTKSSQQTFESNFFATKTSSGQTVGASGSAGSTCSGRSRSDRRRLPDASDRGRKFLTQGFASLRIWRRRRDFQRVARRPTLWRQASNERRLWTSSLVWRVSETNSSSNWSRLVIERSWVRIPPSAKFFNVCFLFLTAVPLSRDLKELHHYWLFRLKMVGYAGGDKPSLMSTVLAQKLYYLK